MFFCFVLTKDISGNVDQITGGSKARILRLRRLRNQSCSFFFNLSAQFVSQSVYPRFTFTGPNGMALLLCVLLH